MLWGLVILWSGQHVLDSNWHPNVLFLMKQVCHRDLKLENTLLDGSQAPRLKICDFGYSKVRVGTFFFFLFPKSVLCNCHWTNGVDRVEFLLWFWLLYKWDGNLKRTCQLWLWLALEEAKILLLNCYALSNSAGFGDLELEGTLSDL